jgi:hypothetical protein
MFLVYLASYLAVALDPWNGENGLAGVRRFEVTARNAVFLLVRELILGFGLGILVVFHFP